MKKRLTILFLLLIMIMSTPSLVFAQGMMGWGNNSDVSSSTVASTAQDQIKGKQIWEKLQAKKIQCKNLTNDNYELLGEYFMGHMIGDTKSHALMNNMMQNMMGKTGEEQMHIILGKRMSGCEPNASTSQDMMDSGMMSMMMGGGMMESAFTPSSFGGTGGGVNSMMGFGYGMMNGFGWGGNLLSIVVLLIVLADLILLGVFLWRKIQKK